MEPNYFLPYFIYNDKKYYINVEDIYKQLNQNNQKEMEIILNEEKFKLSIESNEEEYIIIIKKNDKYLSSHPIFDNPILLIKGEKQFKIMSKEILNKIIIDYNRDYEFLWNNTQIKIGDYELSKIKKIEMKKKISYLNSIETILIKEKYEKEKNIIVINPIKLSPNFFLIEKKIKQNDYFKIILNDNRKELLNKLFEFEKKRENVFYYIIGSEGIGKSITFQYFSCISLSHILYLNLKLFSHLKKEEILDCFYKEITKLFLTHNKNLEIKILQIKDYLSNFTVVIDDKLNSIDFFWELLFYFLNHCKIFFFPLIIILDQYKSVNIDKDNIQINKIIQKIVDLRNLYQIKMIISSSLNNKEIKTVFLNNLSSISYDYKEDSTNLIKLKYSDDDDRILIDNEIEEIINESSDNSENILSDNDDNYNDDNNSVYNFIEKELSNNKEGDVLTTKENNFNSNLCLDNLYSYLTIKEYFNSLINCKELIPEIKEEYYQKCIKLFNFSMKYYINFLNFKENFPKKDISSKMYQELLVSEFLSLNFNHVKEKIYEFYNGDFNLIEKLMELRKNIYKKKHFNIEEFSKISKNYPLKYLKIIIDGKNNFNFNINKTNLTFRLNYINDFIRHSINQIILNLQNLFLINNSLPSGASKGIFFENEVIQKFKEFLMNELKIQNLKTKYLFLLKGITSNSKKTVENKRNEEKMYKNTFYGIQNYSSIIIDDIDENANKQLDKGYNYLFMQMSETGEDFDFSILIDNQGNYNLINFQVTRHKNIAKIKSLGKYQETGEKIKYHIENLYNIKIINFYNKYIIPSNENYKKKKKKKKKISYIFYNENNSKFYEEEGKLLQKKDITKDITKDIINELNKGELEYFNLSLDLLSISTNYYLKKKRNLKKIILKKFRDYLPKKRRIRLYLDNQTKKKIEEIIKKKIFFNEIHYLYLFNFIFGKNVIKIGNKEIIIIFCLNKMLYMYLDEFYCLEEEEEEENKFNNEDLIISNLFDYVSKINKFNYPDKDLITIDEIKKYEAICFCFKIYYK